VLVLIALAVAGLAIWGVFWGCEGEQCRVEGIGAKVMRLCSMLPGFSPKGQGAAGGGGAGAVPVQLTIAQYLLSLLVLIGALRVFAGNLRRDIRVRLAKLRRGHVIVCGLSETGREIAENLRYERGGIAAIALDNDEPNAVALDELRVPILKGDATRFGMLTLAGLRHARGVVITTGSDAVNVEVALRVVDELAAEMVRPWPRFCAWVTRLCRAPQPPPLFVLPEVRSAWLLELLNQPRTTFGPYRIETRSFDIFASAARQLLSTAPFRRRVPPGMRPHLLLAGLGEMGTQIILQAASVAYAVPGCRLAVTVFDQEGEEAAAALDAHFPGLRGVVDIEFVKTSFDADNVAARNEMWEPVDALLRREDTDLFTVAAISSLGEDKESLYVALELRRRLDKLGRFGMPVFARVRRQRGLAEFTERLDDGRSLLDRLTAFGDLTSLTGRAQLIDQTQDRFARALHEAYLAARGPGARPSPADVPWTHLPERFKQSNRAVADHLSTKLGLVGMRVMAGRGPSAEFTDGELETMAIAEHERWWAERKIVGWTLGPRDDVRRIHPDMKPWEELDEGQREYDRVMVRALRENLASIGQVIRRERIIVAFGESLAGAEAALHGVKADEVAIVVFDPDEPESWAFAGRAAAPPVVLWVRWHEGRGVYPLPPAPPDVPVKLWEGWHERHRAVATLAPSDVPPEVRRAVEAAISTRELAARVS
jgi:hypothetical protein